MNITSDLAKTWGIQFFGPVHVDAAESREHVLFIQTEDSVVVVECGEVVDTRTVQFIYNIVDLEITKKRGVTF